MAKTNPQKAPPHEGLFHAHARAGAPLTPGCTGATIAIAVSAIEFRLTATEIALTATEIGLTQFADTQTFSKGEVSSITPF